jgi:hypothetical protein
VVCFRRWRSARGTTQERGNESARTDLSSVFGVRAVSTTIAQAARAAANRARRDGAAQSNPRISATFADDAERYTALGEKFEHSRRSAT